MIVAERQDCKRHFEGFGIYLSRRDDRRAGLGPREASRLVDRGLAPVALDVHFQNRGMVDEAVDGGERHGGVGEDLAPFAERLIGGDEEGSALVSGADQFEEHAGLGLVLGDIGEVVQDQQVVFVELGDGGFEGKAVGFGERVGRAIAEIEQRVRVNVLAGRRRRRRPLLR